MTEFRAVVFGSSWSNGPSASVRTIQEGREFGESYGTTAEGVSIYDRDGDIVAQFRRDPNGDGTEWYEAEI